MKMATKKKTFEDNLEKLEIIIEKLESGDLPLDEAFDQYKEGMDLSLFCQKELQRVEKEVSQLQKNMAGEFVTTPYETQEE